MDVFDLNAILRLDTSDYDDKIGNAAKSARTLGSKIGSALKTTAKVGAAAVGAGAAAVSSIVNQSVNAYKNYEQLVGGVETLFDKNANGVIKNAEQAYKTAGLSMNQYMETVTGFSASLLQSLGGDTALAAGVADIAIRDMSDNANKMGTSMDSIINAYQGFAKGNFTMLDNLKLGYGGTKTEMERLIEDAEALDKSFKATRDENGDLALSFADIVSAIHIVQDNMGITGTTAKEASSTIEGSIASTKAAWDNLLVALSTGEGLDEAISNVVESAKNVVNNIVPVVTTALTGVGDFVKDIGPVIVENLPNLIENLLPSLIEAAVSLVGSLIAALPGILTALWTVLETLFTDNVMPIVDKAVEWGTNLAENIKSGIESAWESVKSAGGELLTKIGDGITEKFATVKAWGTGIVDGIKSGIVSAWDSLTTMISEKIQDVKDFFAGIVSDLKGLFDFEFTLPHIPLPHFSWSWNDLGLIKIPNVSVEWYKKAYESPYMFTKPTVFNGLGFGDGNGGEIVYGHDRLMRDIREASGNSKTYNVTINIDGAKYDDDETLAERISYELRNLFEREDAAYA